MSQPGGAAWWWQGSSNYVRAKIHGKRGIFLSPEIRNSWNLELGNNNDKSSASDERELAILCNMCGLSLVSSHESTTQLYHDTCSTSTGTGTGPSTVLGSTYVPGSRGRNINDQYDPNLSSHSSRLQ